MNNIGCVGECLNTSFLCNDLINDYRTATEFKIKYPNQFKIIRYEDLSVDTFNETKDVFQFIGLPFYTLFMRCVRITMDKSQEAHNFRK